MTLVEALGATAGLGASRGVHTVRAGELTATISHERLYAEAGQLAAVLAEHGVSTGERVAIAIPDPVAFARAFFGVLAAGAVAVPLPPPHRFASLDVHVRRIVLALRQSRVRVLLSSGALADLLRPHVDTAFKLVDVAEARGASSRYVAVSPDAPALVQYTSGTSTTPRGVVLSHRNVLANVEAIRRGLAVDTTDVGVSWLPLFHDMGLIGTLLTPILVGCDCYLSAPEDFARDPLQWLRTISERRATVTVAPSSGYLHALRRVAQPPPDLDLSCLRAALNGAETVDLAVMRAFLAHFAGHGLDPTVFLPVYGLAEATLAVTFPPLGRPVRTAWVDRGRLGDGQVELLDEGAATARALVSVGSPVLGTEIRLVDSDGVELIGPDVVGEIEIRGASVMSVYENDPVTTASVVRAEGWVSTGDLGFRHADELYIAGRRKEMVVVLGQNYYASDVEAIVSGLPALAGGAVLAASAPYEDGEGLLLLVETKHRDAAVRDELAAQIRRAVAEGIGISPREIVFASRGRLPRTSSGKLLRHDVSGLRDHLKGDHEHR